MKATWFKRLSVWLVASYVAVAAIAVAVISIVVHTMAPSVFDQNLQRGTNGRGAGQVVARELRDSFLNAIETSLLLGVLIGTAAAAVIGVLAAWQLLRPINRVREATRRIADGDYGYTIPTPGAQELAALVTDVNQLGHRLGGIEAKRVQLLGDVAHEMRTPLTVIEGYAEGMIDGVIPAGAEELGQLTEEVRRLRRLADDLSALSRTSERRLDLHLERIDLNETVRQTAERLRVQAEDNSVTLTVIPATQPVWVRADRDRLSQVLTNVLGNAIRATPPDGSITVTTAIDKQRALMTVTDTGEGLNETDATQIFERFYRVPGRRTTASDSGSGIGLTISREIMRAHHGDLFATSAGRGHGATFTAWLPLAP